MKTPPSSPTAHAGFIDDLRATWLALPGRRVAAERFAEIREDLVAVYDAELGVGAEQRAVETLVARWGAIEDALEAESRAFDAIVRELGPRWTADPIHANVDLLSALGRPRSEVLYTQAIRSLCARDRRLLRALLTSAAADWTRGVADEAWATAKVEAEELATIGRRDIILDLVIRLGPDLVVLENKVGVRDREQQLDDYAAWARQHVGDSARPPLLLYLTPTAAEPTAALEKDSWICVSYRTLAEAWRGELEAIDGPLADVLRLFLTSVLRHVVGVPPRIARREDKTRLLGYVQAAARGPNQSEN
jgi:hypothetical protein